MNTTERLYREFRAKGYTASQAIHMARTKIAWDAAEADGLVRFRMVPDEEQYDDSYLDTWGMRECDLKRERARLWALIERDGVWGLVAEYVSPVCPCCAHGGVWEQGGSVWGFVGDPDCGYDMDIRSECLDARALARAQSAHKHSYVNLASTSAGSDSEARALSRAERALIQKLAVKTVLDPVRFVLEE